MLLGINCNNNTETKRARLLLRPDRRPRLVNVVCRAAALRSSHSGRVNGGQTDELARCRNIIRLQAE